MYKIVPLAAGVFLLYWPYVWCRYKKENIDSYGLVWKFEQNSLIVTLIVTAVTLSLLTLVALFWPWEDLPHKRSLFTVVQLLFSGLAAAIIEETFFRGWIQPMLRRKLSPITAIVVTNLIFAPAHLFAAPYFLSLLTFFPGLIMSGLREKYGNIFPSILFHFFGNVWAIWFFPSPF